MRLSNQPLALPLDDTIRAIKQSSEEMQSIVWPEISEYLGGGTLIPQEGDPAPVANLLDKTVGIDYLQHNEANGLVRALATRVQHYPPYDYRDFTIRFNTVAGGRTEYEKLLRGAREGLLLPNLTIQAYVDPRNRFLVGALWILTRDLCDYLIKREGSGQPLEILPAYDGTRFALVWLDDLEEAGYTVHGLNVCELRRRGYPKIEDVGLYP